MTLRSGQGAALFQPPLGHEKRQAAHQPVPAGLSPMCLVAVARCPLAAVAASAKLVLEPPDHEAAKKGKRHELDHPDIGRNLRRPRDQRLSARRILIF